MRMQTIEIKPAAFRVWAGGEVHARITDLVPDRVRVVCTDYSMNGFMGLCEVNEIVRRIGAKEVHLNYPYLPYARQDRVTESNESFSLKVFAKLLNSQKFDSVTICDPHSDVAPALIERCNVIPQWLIAKATIPADILENPGVKVISPDAGAYKKISKLIADDSRIYIGVKTRNPDGSISGTDIKAASKVYGETFLIVDDICDGGRTFIEIAKYLQEKAAANLMEDPEWGGKIEPRFTLYLYVTHGIFSRGLGELAQYFKQIFTTDSFTHPEHPVLKVGSL